MRTLTGQLARRPRDLPERSLGPGSVLPPTGCAGSLPMLHLPGSSKWWPLTPRTQNLFPGGGLQHGSGVPWEKALGSKKLKSTHNLDQGGLCGQTRRHSEPKAGCSRASEGPEPGGISLPSVLTPACFSFSHTLALPLTCSVHQHTWHMHAPRPSTFPHSQFSRPRDKSPTTGVIGCLGQVTPPAPGCSGPGGKGTL